MNAGSVGNGSLLLPSSDGWLLLDGCCITGQRIPRRSRPCSAANGRRLIRLRSGSASSTSLSTGRVAQWVGRTGVCCDDAEAESFVATSQEGSSPPAGRPHSSGGPAGDPALDRILVQPATPQICPWMSIPDQKGGSLPSHNHGRSRQRVRPKGGTLDPNIVRWAGCSLRHSNPVRLGGTKSV